MNNEQEMRSAFEAAYGLPTWFVLGRFQDPHADIAYKWFQAGAEWQRGQVPLDELARLREFREKVLAGIDACESRDEWVLCMTAALSELNYPAHEWSLDVPTESGFYWCRWPDDGPGEWQEPQVEELDIQDGIVYLCSMETDVERYPCALWWPIPITVPTRGRP